VERIAAQRLDDAAPDNRSPVGAEATVRDAASQPGSLVPVTPAGTGLAGQQAGAAPLASALGAAARLAADASATAQALENLRRMLERRLPEVAGVPGATLAEPAPGVAATPAPPPLPLHPTADTGGLSDLDPTPPASTEPKLPVPRTAVERRHVDVRGFLAGFALSAAVGVLLYLLMTAG
jgi:hypothetical protein